MLQDLKNGVEGDYESILEYWSDKTIGTADLVDVFVIGHSGIFSGLSELLEIVEQIGVVPTGNNAGHSDVPIENVVISEVIVIE